MKKTKTVILPDGNRLTGYRGELVFDYICSRCNYTEVSLFERWFLPRANELHNIYDIGANIGDHAVYFATHSKANIFSFEPMPVTFEMLKKNIEQNDISDRVKLFNCALGAEDSSAKMQIVTDNMGACSISNEGTENVQVKRLDNMNLPLPDLVKIDVEGYELEVLKGMERTLRESSPVLWIEIFEDTETMPETYRFLSSLGYLPVDCGELPENVLFTKQELTAQEKAEHLWAFAIKALRQNRKIHEAIRNSFKSSHSWKITAPLRAIRRIFQ